MTVAVDTEGAPRSGGLMPRQSARSRDRHERLPRGSLVNRQTTSRCRDEASEGRRKSAGAADERESARGCARRVTDSSGNAAHTVAATNRSRGRPR